MRSSKYVRLMVAQTATMSDVAVGTVIVTFAINHVVMRLAIMLGTIQMRTEEYGATIAMVCTYHMNISTVVQ